MTTISLTTKDIPTAPLGPENPLPHFWWQQPGRLMDDPPVGLSDEEMEGYISMGRTSILPYAVQDNYDRKQRDIAHRIIEIDNGVLKVSVLPDLGGRLYSMVDLATGREMLFCNPVFQPANLSLRNAWFSGGIEWNAGAAPGHAASTCMPVFTHRIDTERGPILRIHEFDRQSETAWQVDLFLPEGEGRCYVHGRIVNPNPQPRRIYWWTNATVPYEDGMRIVAPVDYSVEHVLPDNHLERCAFPDRMGFDGSYPANWASSTSIFFRKPGQDRPWLGACFPEGHGVGQVSTARLRGRKYFFFGNGDGGRHWAEYLSEPDKGQYVEIQAGLMPTQNQLMTLDSNSSVEWTECYVPLADCAAATQSDYSDAVAMVGQEILNAVPADTLANMDAFLTAAATHTPTETLSQGTGWGQLHEAMTAAPISPGMIFAADPVDRFWEDLAAGLSIDPAAEMPNGFATSELWQNLLAEASNAQPDTPVLWLLQGIIALDRDDLSAAENFLRKAFELCPAWASARCLAVLKDRADDTQQAQDWYDRAGGFKDCPPQVALEQGMFLKRAGKTEALHRLLQSLPETADDHERLRILRAEAALARGDYDKLGQLLDYPFATVREGEVILSDLWKSYVFGKAERSMGRQLSDNEKIQALRTDPVPFELNFVMKSNDIRSAE